MNRFIINCSLLIDESIYGSICAKVHDGPQIDYIACYSDPGYINQQNVGEEKTNNNALPDHDL